MSSRGVDDVDWRGIVGKDGGGALEQLIKAADRGPLGNARALDRGVPNGCGGEGGDAPVGVDNACPPSP